MEPIEGAGLTDGCREPTRGIHHVEEELRMMVRSHMQRGQPSAEILRLYILA